MNAEAWKKEWEDKGEIKGEIKGQIKTLIREGKSRSYIIDYLMTDEDNPLTEERATAALDIMYPIRWTRQEKGIA